MQVKPVDGDHKYELAPLAVRVTESPGQMDAEAGSAETEGSGSTVTTTESLSEQLPDTTTTLYVVVMTGLATGFEMFGLLRPEEGLHV